VIGERPALSKLKAFDKLKPGRVERVIGKDLPIHFLVGRGSGTIARIRRAVR
jgi:hypothetical protein